MASITNKPAGLELSIVEPLRGSGILRAWLPPIASVVIHIQPLRGLRNNAGDLQA